MADGTATLALGDKSFDYKLMSGTVGPDVIDIRKLYAPDRRVHLRSGLHLDRELRVALTYIDGDAGVLLHRGYPIEQLAETSSFMEVAICCSTANCRRARAEQLQPHDHAPHDGARAVATLLPRFPPRRAPDGDHVRRGRRAVGLLS